MSKFGWSYPPGCSGTPFDEDGPCEGCCQMEDHCVCDPCPVCETAGDPTCEAKHGHNVHPAIKRLREITEAMWKADAEAQARAEAKQWGNAEVTGAGPVAKAQPNAIPGVRVD